MAIHTTLDPAAAARAVIYLLEKAGFAMTPEQAQLIYMAMSPQTIRFGSDLLVHERSPGWFGAFDPAEANIKISNLRQVSSPIPHVSLHQLMTTGAACLIFAILVALHLWVRGCRGIHGRWVHWPAQILRLALKGMAAFVCLLLAQNVGIHSYFAGIESPIRIAFEQSLWPWVCVVGVTSYVLSASDGHHGLIKWVVATAISQMVVHLIRALIYGIMLLYAFCTAK